MDKSVIAQMLEGIVGSGNVKIDEKMSDHTSFRVGGTADVLVTPCDFDSIKGIVKSCKENNIPMLIMGNGTNLIVRDKGIRGVVVKLRENISGYSVIENEITAQAGILLSRLSRIALENGLTGLEFAEGIPGTLGGAVTMNAGAYNGDMSMVVKVSEYLKPDGTIVTLDNRQHCFGKRSSFVQSDGGVVLRSCIKLKEGSKEEIKSKMDEFGAMRREKQPLELPSAGSVFKRPEGHFAGKLVQDCGLKGFSIGGASVSCLHCGFIVNTGNATANDVISLIEYIKEAVFKRFGVELNTEVKVVGEI